MWMNQRLNSLEKVEAGWNHTIIVFTYYKDLPIKWDMGWCKLDGCFKGIFQNKHDDIIYRMQLHRLLRKM